jgi:hypothetical protein
MKIGGIKMEDGYKKMLIQKKLVLRNREREGIYI